MLAVFASAVNEVVGSSVHLAGDLHNFAVREPIGNFRKGADVFDPLPGRVLRFRGGADSDDPIEAALRAKTQTGKMSREEILEKLNRVPVFYMAYANGSIVNVPDADGKDEEKHSVWYLDAGEAQVALRGLVAAEPLSGVQLRTQALGEVFTMCNGWPDNEVATTANSDGTRKLQAAKAILQHCDAQLIDTLQKQDIDPGSWRLPIFIGEALAQAGPNGEQIVLPIFFRPEDLQIAYTMAKVPPSEMEKGMSVMDIRSIVARMAEEPVDFPNPWRAIQFVVTPAARKLADELEKKHASI